MKVRVCLNCEVNSDANAEKEFHQIFDEVGLKLQLPFLVKTFFYIDVRKKDEQHLCDDCVNRLTELYDLDELAKEKSCKTNNLKVKSECSNNKECSQYLQNESFDSNNSRADGTEINKHNKSEDKDCMEYANIEDAGYFFNKNRSAPFAQHQNHGSNNIAEDFLEDGFDQTGKREVSQDINISLSSSVIKDEKSYEKESDEHMEFISDDENQNAEIYKQSNANIIFGSKKLDTKLRGDKQNFNISFSLSPIKYEKSDELESNEHMEFISDDENQNVEINKQSNTNIIVNVREEVDEAEQPYAPKQTHNENKVRKDLYVEEVDDRSNQAINSDDSNSLLEELKITEFNNIKHINSNDFIEQEDISDNTISLEEENLKEKIVLSEEYDQVYLNEYLDKVLKTKFQDLELNWEMECKLCLEKYYSFEELLKHACIVEFEKEQQLSCIIKDCQKDAKDLPTLARHLILTHYDKLESITIYSKCTDCKKTFSNVLDFNKHSCCRNKKRKAGALNCKYCDLYFQSSKRYRFHMQFHLKRHRPKICLLCGYIFNNSDDFFEHTHSKHAMSCERCDRFFKDINIFNSHMKLHQDLKYECTLCPKKCSTEFGLNQHMEIDHKKRFSVLQCEYCAKKYIQKRSYRNHIKSHHTDSKVQAFICSTCGLIARNMEMIKEHIKSDNESPCFSSPLDEKRLGLGYSCENCSLDFCTIKHLKDHRLSDSHVDNLFHCGLCRKSFNTLIDMGYHTKNHRDFKEWQQSFPISRRFVCNIGDCQLFYSKLRYLTKHKTRPHKTENRQQFHNSSQPSLAVDVAYSNNNGRIKCLYCKSTFSSQNILKGHIDKYHTPAECDICLKKYKSHPLLKRHRDLVHKKIENFFCKHCQKGFLYKSLRNLHEKNVHPKNAFKCKLCNYKTTNPKPFEIHMDKHKNGKHFNKGKYSCVRYLKESGCDASFSSYYLLKKHAQTKHENSTFCINLEIKRRRKTDRAVVKFENVSYNIMTCDDSSKYEKRAKTSHEVYLNDKDFEQAAIISTLENDMEFEEQKPDTESLTI